MMWTLSSIVSGIFFAILVPVFFEVNASPIRSSVASRTSPLSHFSGRGQPLFPRMTIGYGYLSNTAMCAEYHKGMTVIDWLKPHPNFFNLSPIPRFNAGSMSEAPVGSCECIFEANKYQFLDSDLHYGLPHLSKEPKISFSNPRNTIPRVLLSPCNGGTKELNITMFCNKECKKNLCSCTFDQYHFCIQSFLWVCIPRLAWLNVSVDRESGRNN
ncbi:uncharacterized protein C8R40DRAFT_1262626 [Lentinula edodes]|uniref:uncharacterized protein n=1 Tax=Lentinula edodes TaxID=5353 RepID=UPI001E8EAD37|nr:uncharacterized protein C8R40DRAFT_1262626 [Lentinula edodes]KAH7879969.1 hypothetical protein C8R40DRAFT_1262626 [Lentinula edodes]